MHVHCKIDIVVDVRFFLSLYWTCNANAVLSPVEHAVL